jgi:hypothetical protein
MGRTSRNSLRLALTPQSIKQSHMQNPRRIIC